MFAFWPLAMAILFNITACGGINPNSTASFDKFRTGHFKYADEARFGDFVITRTADSQVDSGTLTQLVVKFDLEWETDTSYVLKYKETLANPQSIQLPDLTGMNRHCYMTEPDDTSYLEVSTSSLTLDTQIIMTRIVLRK
ncbi:MAG: hypothetical protein IPM82_17470 [Saprospiraceae bacterium]|nr:hypothetical protein [Saprospiraceae bacterium]